MVGTKDKTFFVYILRTSRNTLYTGQTNDLDRRLKEHIDKKGRGAKYTRGCDSCELVYFEKYQTRTEALQREAAIKKMTRCQKDKLVESMS
ncbi:MAG TPA: GIY-YIG nuclease family protein [Patescibacteria group bacterium]